MPTIKEEMAALDKRDFKWYANLSAEDQKSLSMYVLMRFAATTNSNVTEINEHYLTMVNELVNVHFNDMRHHPELQWRLIQCASIGTIQSHQWVKPMKKKKEASLNPKLFAFYETQYPHFNDDEIESLIRMQSKDDMKELLNEHGLSDKEIKALIK
jgi:hypothetical protein